MNMTILQGFAILGGFTALCSLFITGVVIYVVFKDLRHQRQIERQSRAIKKERQRLDRIEAGRRAYTQERLRTRKAQDAKDSALFDDIEEFRSDFRD